MKDGPRPGGHDSWRSCGSSPAALREAPFLRKIWHSTRTRWQRFALALFVGWATYLLLLSPQGWLQLWRLRRDARELRQEIAQLSNTREALDRIIVDLTHDDPPLLERRAREEFGFARDNERIYVLPFDAQDRRCMRQAELHGGERFRDRDPRPATPPGNGAARDAAQPHRDEG